VLIPTNDLNQRRKTELKPENYDGKDDSLTH